MTETRLLPGTRVRVKPPYRKGHWHLSPVGVVVRSMPSKYHEGRTVVCVLSDQWGLKSWLDETHLEPVTVESLSEDQTCIALARAVLSGDKVAARALADRVSEILG